MITIEDSNFGSVSGEIKSVTDRSIKKSQGIVVMQMQSER